MRNPEILHNEICQRLDTIIRLLQEKPPAWYCGCGHWNGCNLAVCALCGRTPGESLSK